MAQKAKPAEHGGGVNSDVCDFVERIENLHDKLDSMKGSYMADCKVVRDDIKEIYKEAKEQGLSKKALAGAIETRALLRKAEKVRANLEPEEQDEYDLIRHALGDLEDTPLGQAALAAAGANGASPEATA